jgi:exodeoxyribonuclease VII small subunit
VQRVSKDNIDNIRTFAEARSRLEEIVGLVKDKNLPLEKSLDLYEEAIELGNRCSDLIDDTDFSADEIAAFEADRRAGAAKGNGADATAEKDDGAGASGPEGASTAEKDGGAGASGPEGASTAEKDGGAGASGPEGASTAEKDDGAGASGPEGASDATAGDGGEKQDADPARS